MANPNVVNGSFHKGANSVATKTSFSLSAALLPVAIPLHGDIDVAFVSTDADTC
jgi:hypothetical protein